jgi:hypothetical protein
MLAWYNNLKSSSTEGFSDLCAKLVACFYTNIPIKIAPRSYLVLPSKKVSLHEHI